MSKKHFVALAGVIRTSRDKYTDLQIQELASFCASQNGQFDRARFLAACGE